MLISVRCSGRGVLCFSLHLWVCSGSVPADVGSVPACLNHYHSHHLYALYLMLAGCLPLLPSHLILLCSLPQSQGNYVALLGNILFPLIAFGGLFFLFRRGQGGQGEGRLCVTLAEGPHGSKCC